MKAKLFGVAIALVLGLPFLVLLRPTPPPAKTPLPVPNGYDDFLKGGQVVEHRASDYRELSEEQLRGFLSRNAEPLKLVQSGLAKECRVPIKFSTNFFHQHLPELATLKSLAFVLAAQGRLAELENRPGDAAKSYLDTVRFGQELARGGMLIDKLVGIAVEAMGLTKLETLHSKLDAKQCREAVQTLEAIEGRKANLRETFDKEAWWAGQLPFMQRLGIMWASRSMKTINTQSEKKIHSAEKRRQLLMMDLGARAYELENGKRPQGIADLVPAYIHAVPIDPDTGTNLVYLLRPN